jgi:EAL domain-containing protein (putative c-di-GMP-specific phosphodiesterase class I)
MSDSAKSKALLTLPYLEHFPARDEAAHRIVLDKMPFRIGRSMTSNYVICSRNVSKDHSEIFREGQEFRIRDLGSTNGTFVNSRRIQVASLVHGDIIHVARNELRFGYEPNQAPPRTDGHLTEPAANPVPTSIIRSRHQLRELLSSQSVRVVFQPIVDLATRTVMGYEALGRGTHSELSTNPAQLFDLADQCQLACELSRLFRCVASEDAKRLPQCASVFFNLHPSEMLADDLLESLRETKSALQKTQKMVLEVHEGLVTDIASMHRLRHWLNELDIALAYDDFGAGQARLAHLADVPPDYIKLDRSLIRALDRGAARQDVIQALNSVCGDLNVKSIAEGIQTIAEADACRRLGCHFGQGFLFGPPRPVAQLGVTASSLAEACSK